MRTKIAIHLLFCFICLLLPKTSGSGESNVSLPALPEESSVGSIIQSLLRLGLSFESAIVTEEAKFRKWKHISKLLPKWDKLYTLCDIQSMKCELSWFLDIVGFDEAIKCVEKWCKNVKKPDEKMLVNAFADRHAFELEQMATQGEVPIEDDNELRHRAKELVSLEGAKKTVAPLALLRHSLKLLRGNPESPKLQDMTKNLMTLHLTSLQGGGKNEAISAIYAELKVDVPTLVYVNLPRHAAAAVVTRHSNDTYDIVLINSGSGVENHQSEFIQEKSFHKAQQLGLSLAFVPTMEFKGITKEQLKRANYHSGSIKQAYYKDQPEVKAVEKQHIMPWELSDSQGIGSCTFSSIWYTLRFYYQALAFESDIRLSLLEDAISETVELQSRIQKVDDELDADYFKRKEVSKDAPYYSETVKKVWAEKDKLQSNLRVRRELIVVGLNGILQNLITLFHELKDIRTKMIFWENNEPQSWRKSKWVVKEKLRKASAREKLLAEEIPRIMTSFHAFWAKQQGQCASNPRETEAEMESRVVRCMSWSAIEDDTRTLYSDAVKLIEGKDLELVKGQLGTLSIKKNESLNVHFLPIHESLRLLLDRIIVGGDSEALRGAIDVHLGEHSKHPQSKEANYLLVLYAALGQNASLLDYLVNVKGLPLVHRFHAIVQKDRLMLLYDMKSEKDISTFAALEFRKYGQPLDNFLQLFTLKSKEAKSVANRFVQEYQGSIPTGDYDAALTEFAENGRLALLAYTAPKASHEARASLFMKSDDVRVLSILHADANQEELSAKVGEAVARGSTAIVEFLFPRWLRKKRLLKASESVKEDVTIPEKWLLEASRGPFLDIVRILLPHSSQLQVDKCLLEAASLGHAGVAVLLAEYSSTRVPDAVTSSIEQRHFELASTLIRLYPSKNLIKDAFIESAAHGNLDLIREFINSVGIEIIDTAIGVATRHGRFGIAGMLLEHASQSAIEKAAKDMIGKESASSVFARTLMYISDSASSLFTKAMEAADHKAMKELLPFVTLEDIEGAFSGACNENDLAAVSLLIPFAKTKAANSCFKKLIGRETTPSELLEQLLPHVSRETVFEIHKSPKRKEHLKESTLAAISKRVEGFPIEIVFVHAFRSNSEWWCSSSEKGFVAEEEKKYGIKLPPLCTNFEECTKTIKELPTTQVPIAALEEAMDVDVINFMFEDEELVKAAPLLVPFATPLVCTLLMGSSPNISVLVPTVACACAGKALEDVVRRQCMRDVSEETRESLEALIPHLSPPQIIYILTWMKILEKPQNVSKIADMLSKEQIDGALNLATRQCNESSTLADSDVLLLTNLLQKASKSVVDVSLLHASRYRRANKELVKVLSEYATEEGRMAAEQLAKRIHEE